MWPLLGSHYYVGVWFQPLCMYRLETWPVILWVTVSSHISKFMCWLLPSGLSWLPNFFYYAGFNLLLIFFLRGCPLFSCQFNNIFKSMFIIIYPAEVILRWTLLIREYLMHHIARSITLPSCIRLLASFLPQSILHKVTKITLS